MLLMISTDLADCTSQDGEQVVADHLRSNKNVHPQERDQQISSLSRPCWSGQSSLLFD